MLPARKDSDRWLKNRATFTETRAALRSAGWAEPTEAVEVTGRTLREIATLWDQKKIQVLEIGPWWVNDVPRALMMIRLDELQGK